MKCLIWLTHTHVYATEWEFTLHYYIWSLMRICFHPHIKEKSYLWSTWARKCITVPRKMGVCGCLCPFACVHVKSFNAHYGNERKRGKNSIWASYYSLKNQGGVVEGIIYSRSCKLGEPCMLGLQDLESMTVCEFSQWRACLLIKLCDPLHVTRASYFCTPLFRSLKIWSYYILGGL